MNLSSRESTLRPGKRLPSTATISSPSFSVAAAGDFGTISPTVWVGLSTPIMKTKKKTTKARAMLTAGPAPITKIRFQTGCS